MMDKRDGPQKTVYHLKNNFEPFQKKYLLLNFRNPNFWVKSVLTVKNDPHFKTYREKK